jgi:hypothetical protein
MMDLWVLRFENISIKFVHRKYQYQNIFITDRDNRMCRNASEFYYNASDFEAHCELPYNNDDKNYFLLDEYMTYDQLYALAERRARPLFLLR